MGATLTARMDPHAHAHGRTRSPRLPLPPQARDCGYVAWCHEARRFVVLQGRNDAIELSLPAASGEIVTFAPILRVSAVPAGLGRSCCCLTLCCTVLRLMCCESEVVSGPPQPTPAGWEHPAVCEQGQGVDAQLHALLSHACMRMQGRVG